VNGTNVKVSLIKVVQLRTEYFDEESGKMKGWNDKFHKPGNAAAHWANSRTTNWWSIRFNEKELGAGYHRAIQADYDEKARRYEVLVRRSLPIFKRMLA